MTQQYKWLSTVAQMKVLAAELIRAAEIMGGDDEESQDVELILAVAPAGTVLDDDHAVNDTPVLTVSLAEYPEEGGYPVDPHDPTGGRIDAPCQTCNGHGMVGGWIHSGANPAEYDAEPCPDCTPPASAQDDAKDERQAFEAWFTRNDETKDMAERAVRRSPSGAYVLMQTYTAWEVWQAARAYATAAGDARDAKRYRWLREEAQYYPYGRAPAVVLCDESDLFQKGDAGSESGFVYGGQLDAAIDEAIAASQQQEG